MKATMCVTNKLKTISSSRTGTYCLLYKHMRGSSSFSLFHTFGTSNTVLLNNSLKCSFPNSFCRHFKGSRQTNTHEEHVHVENSLDARHTACKKFTWSKKWQITTPSKNSIKMQYGTNSSLENSPQNQGWRKSKSSLWASTGRSRYCTQEHKYFSSNFSLVLVVLLHQCLPVALWNSSARRTAKLYTLLMEL